MCCLFAVLIPAFSALSVGNIVHSSALNVAQSVDSIITKSKGLAGISENVMSDSSSAQIFKGAIKDSVKVDSISNPFAESDIKSPIKYTAEDSIVYDITNKFLYLFGKGTVEYEKINLQGAKVQFDWTSNTMTAEGVPDSTGTIIGKPVFKDDDKTYNATKFSYNFKNKKGKVYEVITEESGGFVRLAEGKRTDDSSWYGKNAWFTTCDDREHPHFYIRAAKAKIVPNKLIVTGPANLVVAGVPTPLYLPFAIFPLKQGRRSGILFPQYGDSRAMGFFLKDGGYYFAIKEKYGLAIMGDIYTKGSFGIKTNFQYNEKYKYNGALTFSYFRRRPENPEKPGSASSNDFAVTWRHSQDPKARPFTTFTGSVNFQTSTFLRNSLVIDQSLQNTVLNSNLVYSKSFRGLPFNLSVSASHNQNLRNRSLRIDLPIFTFNVTRVAPFKSKVSSGKIKWYENIGISYNLEAKSYISTYDSLFLKRQTLDQVKYGARQTFRIDAPISVFKYIKVNPSFDYTGRFYFKEIEKRWDPATYYVSKGGDKYDTIRGRVVTDTFSKFRALHEFSVGLNISTKLVGIFKFKNPKVMALRHIFTPSIGFTYKPNFGTQKWNYYGNVQQDLSERMVKYSKFENVQDLYGVPSNGMTGSISFGIGNNFELKVYSKKDSVKHERKIPILDNFSIQSSYNFAADSLRLAPFRFSANSSAIPNLNIQFGFVLSPYAVNQNNQPYNKWLWNDRKKLLRLTNANVTLAGRFQSKKAPNPSKTNTLNPQAGMPDPNDPLAAERTYVMANPDYFYDFKIPWAFSIGYNFNMTRGKVGNPDTSLITQSLVADVEFNLTKAWKVNARSGFDFTSMRPTLTTLAVVRDLHCWELSFNWTAYPVQYQTYLITLKVKSPVLQDLKLTKKRQYVDSSF